MLRSVNISGRRKQSRTTQERTVRHGRRRDGLVVEYTFTNTSARARRLVVQFSVKTDLLPVWSSEQLGIRDAPDSVAWQAETGIFVARDTRNPWFCVVDPHLPTGWEDIAIEDLPIGRTTVSFSRARAAKGIEYRFAAKDDGWKFILKAPSVLAGTRYYLNGRPVSVDSSGIRMSGRKNRVLVVQ